MSKIKIKRIYESPQREDGYRILVDRLWPRGISKEKAKIDQWIKSIAPSNELRQWYAHDKEKWFDFQQKYLQELKTINRDELQNLHATLGTHKTVTFLYSSKETKYNNAAALKLFIDEKKL